MLKLPVRSQAPRTVTSSLRGRKAPVYTTITTDRQAKEKRDGLFRRILRLVPKHWDSSLWDMHHSPVTSYPAKGGQALTNNHFLNPD